MSIETQSKIKKIQELLKLLKSNIDWENFKLKLETLKKDSEKEGFWENHHLAQQTMKEIKLIENKMKYNEHIRYNETT